MCLRVCLCPSFCVSRDRTCTVINVEGDAFGAGLLQYFVDRNPTATLSEVRVEEDAEPEQSPLIQKGLEGAAAPRS